LHLCLLSWNFDGFTERRLFYTPGTVKLCESPGKAGRLLILFIEKIYKKLERIKEKNSAAPAVGGNGKKEDKEDVTNAVEASSDRTEES
jgi:hypothetical protein